MPLKRKKENVEVNLQRGTMSGNDVHNYVEAHFQPEDDWVVWGDTWISTSAALTKEINRKRKKTEAPPTQEDVALWREGADHLLGAYPHETDDMYDMYRAMSGGPRVNPGRRAMMTHKQEELRDLREQLEKDKAKLAAQRKARKSQRIRKRAKSSGKLK